MNHRVHIVATDDGWVLDHLASILARGTGWSMSGEIDPNADINYFFPYLHWRECTTMTAAWFTHYDAVKNGKSSRWDDAAKHVNLCLTTAPMYLDRLPIGSKVVPPPIDLHFIPGERGHRDGIIRIGVGGMTYNDGRKGEDLVSRLVKSDLPVQWAASGRGWPIPNTFLPADGLPGYYQSLDIFLCASRIEGIPMPPLEALACGIPVIIPRGVGMLDELPDIHGIYRFDAGDYDELYAVIRAAVMELMDSSVAFDTEALRASVAGYTAEAWCQAHRDAILSLVEPVALPAIPKLKPWKGRSGVYYVAFGEPARECAATAIRSWKEHMSVPVALVSDSPLGIEDVFIQQDDIDIGGRTAKLRVNDLAPQDWDYILYLDADTEIIADVGHFFRLLQDGWEFIICRDPDKYATTRNMRRPDNGDEVDATYTLMGTEDALQWNGGVFAFRRNERTADFFHAWQEEWDRWGKRDQAALLRAMWRTPLRTFTLGVEWNTITRYYERGRSAGVLHHPMTARRWHGIVNERLDSPEAFRRVVK